MHKYTTWNRVIYHQLHSERPVVFAANRCNASSAKLFCSQEEIKGASLGNWGHAFCLCRPEDTGQGEERRSSLIHIHPGVSEGHTCANIYKSKFVYIFFRSLCFLCLLMQLHTDLQCRWRWGEGYTWLIIALCVKNTIISAIAARLTTN